MPNKLSQEEVEKRFEERGYKMIGEYKNANTKVQYFCYKHPDKILFITVGSLSSGNGCKYCAGMASPTIEEIKKEFEKHGLEWLGNDYKNTHTGMSCRCPLHPDKELKISYSHLKQGQGCKYCGKYRRYTIEEVTQIFAQHGFKLLDKNYKNARTNMHCQCLVHQHKEMYMSLDNINRGHGCAYCAGLGKYTAEDIKQLFIEHGYKWLGTEAITTDIKTQYECPNHPQEKIYIKLSDLKSGRGCPQCAREKNSGTTANNWHGGVTNLNTFLRTQINNWKKEVFEKNNYKCIITSKNGKLNIHHLIPFFRIRDKIIKELNLPIYKTMGEYTEKQLKNIVSKLNYYHNDIMGIPLLVPVHKLFHKIYGNNASEQDFYEFKDRWNNGEFKNKSS